MHWTTHAHLGADAGMQKQERIADNQMGDFEDHTWFLNVNTNSTQFKSS